ncbi:MAG: glycosyltransferase family 39 protein [Lachnospiraceae bacterium]|nr:glycosyltransferase family 39 protein [Lachnospiraceae bacterium]
MEQKKRFFSHQFIAIALLLFGIAVRCIGIGSIPGGLNQDEAFGAYEAYSMLHYGMDSSGYAFPVYLNTWGSGMSALNSYLMIPFMALFGVHAWVIRMPQLITSCVALYVIYRLFLRLFNEKAALIGLLYFAVCPYHIMMSRWGIDCNLAPAFLLFGFYCFVIGVEKPKYYMLSALLYGLSLYCYATIWLIVPFMILLPALYVLYTGKLRWCRYLPLSVLILGILALPLLLFLLVNKGYIAEIKLAFLSIPKLTVMRDSEVTFHYFTWYLRQLLTMLVRQSDGLVWNSAPVGLYYRGFLVFALIGGIYWLKRAFTSIRKRAYDPFVLLIFPLICAVFLGCLIQVNVNKINCIHIPIVTFIITGLYVTCTFVEKYFRYAVQTLAGGLLILFIVFASWYVTDFREEIGTLWCEGLEDAVAYADAQAALTGSDTDPAVTIYVDPSLYYPKILLYSKLPVTTYRETVVYNNYPSICLWIDSCGPYVFLPEAAEPGDLCIIPESEIEAYEAKGFTVTRFGHSAVVQ